MRHERSPVPLLAQRGETNGRSGIICDVLSGLQHVYIHVVGKLHAKFIFDIDESGDRIPRDEPKGRGSARHLSVASFQKILVYRRPSSCIAPVLSLFLFASPLSSPPLLHLSLSLSRARSLSPLLFADAPVIDCVISRRYLSVSPGFARRERATEHIRRIIYSQRGHVP